jgi:hypothetical protein
MPAQQQALPLYANLKTLLMRYLLISLFLISCNQTPDKKQEIANPNQQVTTDTIPSAKRDTLKVDTFSITRLIPEFSKDTNFSGISGITVGTDIQKTVIYSIYKLPKKKAFEILSKKNKRTISSNNKNVPAYSDLVKIDSLTFFKAVYREYEQNPTAQKFYDKLNSLKKYDIFFVSSYGYLHWLFFDRNSDTVYQRTQLLTY